jgi:chemotaxis family two-component system response regulator Rcp1
MEKEALVCLINPCPVIPPTVWDITAQAKREPAKPKRLDILLVEDIPVDICIVAEGLAEIFPAARLSVARNGGEALDFLRQLGKYANAPRPDLILLDLQLGKKSGFEVLREVKQDPALASIPVVVQTSSEAAADIREAYRLHANSYVTKAVTFDEFYRTMQALLFFWVTVAKLPGRN